MIQNNEHLSEQSVRLSSKPGIFFKITYRLRQIREKIDFSITIWKNYFKEKFKAAADGFAMLTMMVERTIAVFSHLQYLLAMVFLGHIIEHSFSSFFKLLSPCRSIIAFFLYVAMRNGILIFATTNNVELINIINRSIVIEFVSIEKGKKLFTRL